MRGLIDLGATGLMLFASAAAAVLGGEPGAVDSAIKIKAVTVPGRSIPQPEARGKGYPVPDTKWSSDPVLWGWTCELPDGSGLAFGGIHQTADDGIAHTRLKEGGAWKPLIDELRKANPLQKRNEQVRALRNACKDTLAKARHLYFEGKPAAEEAKLLKDDIDPAVEECAKDIGALVAEFRGLSGLGEHEAGQVKFAIGHLEAAAGFIKPFGALTTPGQMAAVRKGQIELEIAAEAFDAEPPPRALSKIAYDSKTRLFAIFGGEHLDYSTNDLWVFDPAKRRWFQRHPETAPEPRFDAHLEAQGDGRLAMRGGCVYEGKSYLNAGGKEGYIHVGPARWIYDLEKNTWTADGHQEKTFPSDRRSARYYPPSDPERFMSGPRPDAAANEAKLKALPVNTLTRINPAIRLGDRVWATTPYDPDRDTIYVWAGGHSSYAGSDVARFHLATSRWEVSDPVELPLGCIGSNDCYPGGVNFSQRPWVKSHVWNAQAYDADLKKMIMGGVNNDKLDPSCYFYDPDRADWTGRLRLPAGMYNEIHNIQLRHTKHGMFAWSLQAAWLLDSKTTKWQQLKVQGGMPRTVVDSCGMIYDPKRDRMLLMSQGEYGRPYDGQIHALDMATSRVTPLNPGGMDHSKSWNMMLREAVYHPDSDLFIWFDSMKRKGAPSGAGVYPAYDAAKNRWVSVKIAMGAGAQQPDVWHGSPVYDAKRGLIWVVETSYNECVHVLRFDAGKAEITPLKDSSQPPPAPADGKK